MSIRWGAVLLAVALALPAAGVAADLQVGTVTIRPLDVFDDEEARSGWLYDLANALHVQTRESVIRSFLLFREGEVYDPERIAASERNLRALPFLSHVSITTTPPRDGVVDVVVTTRDSWSTEPGFSAGSRGGASSFGFDLEEGNVLGTGRSLGLLYDSTPDRTRNGVRFHDPAFFRPYLQADALVAENSDGSELFLSVRRPFASLETRTAGVLSFSDAVSDRRLYRDGRVDRTFREDRMRLLAEGAIAWRRASLRAKRVAFGIDFEDVDFEAAPEEPGGLVPPGRSSRDVFVRFESRESRFVKLNWVNRDLRDEDFNLGREISLQLGVSPRFLGADEDSAKVILAASRGFRPADRTFLLSSVQWESRFGAARANRLLEAELLGIHRFASQRPQTFVGRIHFEKGEQMDPERQLFADADSGLRGYRLHAFEGDTLLVLNAEHRVFLGREIAHLISPGAAVFVDAGGVSAPGADFDLHLDAGVGLRLGVTRSPRNSLRVDFAYAFDPDPAGRKGWVTSISMSRAF